METDVLSTPGHLVSLAARGFARLSEARLKPLGFGPGHLPVLVALRDGRASTQRDLARFAKVEQPPMAQMLARMERDELVERSPDPRDGRSQRVALTEDARTRMPEAVDVLLEGNRQALAGFSEEETRQLAALLARLIANLDEITGAQPHARPDASGGGGRRGTRDAEAQAPPAGLIRRPPRGAAPRRRQGEHRGHRGTDGRPIRSD